MEQDTSNEDSNKFNVTYRYTWNDYSSTIVNSSKEREYYATKKLGKIFIILLEAFKLKEGIACQSLIQLANGPLVGSVYF